MSTKEYLVSCNIKLMPSQRDFIRSRYGNLSRWVRTEIDKERGAVEAELSKFNQQLINNAHKQKPPVKPATWKFPR